MRALLLALLLLAVAAPGADARRAVPQGWLGVVADGPVTAAEGAEWDRMVRAGVESVRVAFRWSQLQPHATWAQVPAADAARFRGDPAATPTDFTATDALVAAAVSRGIAVLPVVEYVPAWAAAKPGDAASPPADLGAVERVHAALVARYGPRGSFWAERPDLPRLPIRAWQVFNEPNLPVFWSEQPFATGYVAALRAASAGIRGIDPGATVVLAGLVNYSWRDLRRVYAAGGRGLFDAVAVHPYTRRPENVIRVLRYVRRVMDRAGDRRKPIWVTEFTWAAAKGRGDARIFGATPRQQGQRLRRFARLLMRDARRLRVARAFWYTWLSVEDRAQEFSYSGLRLERGGVRRDTPALAAFRGWARRIQGCVKAPGDARRCA